MRTKKKFNLNCLNKFQKLGMMMSSKISYVIQLVFVGWPPLTVCISWHSIKVVFCKPVSPYDSETGL